MVDSPQPGLSPPYSLNDGGKHWSHNLLWMILLYVAIESVAEEADLVSRRVCNG